MKRNATVVSVRLLLSVAWLVGSLFNIGPLPSAAAAGPAAPSASRVPEPASMPLALVATDASVSLNVPPVPFIGTDVHFTVTFDNVSATDPGYGPYIDLYLPLSGVDGLSGGGPNDGLNLTSATFLGAALPNTVIDCPAGSTITHPLTKLPVVCPTAMPTYTGPAPFHWQLNVLTLPFGSFTNNQPPAVVDVTAAMSNFADLGKALTIRANGGFMFGADPLDNPLTDPPLIGPTVTADTTPSLMTLKKIYLGPEDETATGPNYPRQYDIQVEVAPGQTITNLLVSDVLSNNVQYQTVDFTRVHSASVGTTAVSTPLTTIPGGTLSRLFATTTGSLASVDAEVQFTYYIPLSDTNNAAVINPLTGDDVLSLNEAKAVGSWQPLDPRDAGAIDNAIADPPGPEHILTDKSIAIQKGVTNLTSAVNNPDDVLSYTLNFQVSDFFVFKDVVISDTLSDGQHFDPSFAPTVSINGNTFTLATTAFSPANYTVDTSQIGNDTNPATDGTTALYFRVSDQLITSGHDGRMVGGCVPPGGTGGPVPDCGTYNDGATTGTVVFHAKILHNFTDTYPSGDQSVDQGDILTNSVLVDGNLLGVADAITPTGFREADDSHASIQIPRGVLSKTIYAVNGVVCAPCTNVQISPDFTVTYRLQYQLPTSNEEGLTISDYLPLPVFLSGEMTTFDDVTSAAAPDAGHAQFGPADTFRLYSGIVPTMTEDTVANSVTFSYPNFDNPADLPNLIDLLLTVTASHQHFADRLLLTNEAHSFEGSTNAGTQTANNIVQVVLDEPLLSIQKGVIATDDPKGVFVSASSPPSNGPVPFSAPGGACPRYSGTINSTNLITAPVNSDITNIDAADQVSFGIVISNTGHAVHGAFDVTISDTLPSGFHVPAGGLNLCVTNGAGTPISYTGTLTGGILLTDGGPLTGSLSAYTTTLGTNVALITFDLQADNNLAAGTYVNTAVLGNYTAVPNGPNFLLKPLTDPAFITMLPGLSKSLVTTEIVTTTNLITQVVVGELVTYSVVLQVPEGIVNNAVLTDTLDNGLAFVSFDGFSNSNPISVTLDNNPPVPTIASSGHQIIFNLGTITDTNLDNSLVETLRFTYTVVALNVVGNQAGTQLNNSIRINYTGGKVGPVSAPNVHVIEPSVNLAKNVTPGNGDAGDVFTYTLVLSNSGGVDAFGVAVNDPLPTVGGPSQMLAPSLGVADSASTLTTGDFTLTGSDAAGWVLNTLNPFDLLAGSGRVVTLTLSGALPLSVVPGSTFTNSALATWTSLPGNPGTRSTFNINATERTGAGGPGPDISVLNNYATPAAAPFPINSNVPSKTLVSTSEPHTLSSTLAIGEIVRFRLTVQLAEGTSPSLTLQDKLPAGLTYLNDGTTRVAFVADGAGITSTAVSGAGLNVNGNETTVGAVVPSFVLPGGDIFGGPFTSGTDPGFNLGDVVNHDSDPNQEFVVIEFNALAANVLGNQAGTVLTNTFAELLSGAQIGPDSNGVPVIIAEPVLTITKSLSALLPILPGAPITFTIRVTNTAGGPSAAAAFEVALTDTLDSRLIGPFQANPTVDSSTPCGVTTPAATSHFTGQVLTATVTCLNPGQGLTLTVSAFVAPTATINTLLTNTVQAVWTSLPLTGTLPGGNNPTGSRTPGNSGAPNGERDGSNGPGPDNSVLNNYAASASLNLQLGAPAIDKLQPVPPDYTIGEPVTFTIVITVPEGLTPNLVVSDSLPGGLVYISHQVISTTAGSGGVLGQNFSGSLTSTPIFTNTPGLLQFGFGNVTATAEGNLGNDSFVVQIVARVANIITNQAGTVLTNTASMLFAQNGGTTTVTDPTPAVIVVVEPVLSIKKTVPATPHIFYPGDVVTYTVVVSHTGTSQRNAYDVVITDTLPANLINVSASASRSDGLVLSNQIAGGVLRVPNLVDGSFDLPLGLTVTVLITGQVDFAAHAGDIVTNTAAATWTSRPGPVLGERTAGDGLLFGGGLNDYEVAGGIYFYVGTTTVIDLVSFTGALQPDGSVKLAWQTGAEIDTAGFNLYRAASANGSYTRINPQLIAAQGTAGSGASYTLSDNPGTGTWYYKLEDVDTHNVRTLHGPISVSVSGTQSQPIRVYFPIVGR